MGRAPPPPHSPGSVGTTFTPFFLFPNKANRPCADKILIIGSPSSLLDSGGMVVESSFPLFLARDEKGDALKFLRFLIWE